MTKRIVAVLLAVGIAPALAEEAPEAVEETTAEAVEEATTETVEEVAPVYTEEARGTVFRDDNGNGSRDSGEPGIADVRVSNGREVTLTDADGDYRIGVAEGTIIFVTKPAGYMTPVNADMLPRFHYIHQRAGSRKRMRYRGIDPTGPLPERIDFPLVRVDEEPAVFDAILFADPQPQTEAELDYIRDGVIAELIGTDARFGMTMGDILFDDLAMFPRYNRLIARMGIPWYNVPGNHEMNLDADGDGDSLETFKRHFGPPYYSFEVGDAVFFVLDNIVYQGGGEVTADNLRGNGRYVAELSQDQLTWLGNELAHIPDDRLLFFAMHAPLEIAGTDAPGVTTSNRRALFEMLGQREHLYAVAGHTHTVEHRYFDADDGFAGPEPFHHHVLSTVSGSWWSGPFDEEGVPVSWQRDGTPNGYHILTVDGVDMSVRFKAAGKPADYQMRIMFDVAHHRAVRDSRPGELFDGRMTVEQAYGAEVYVNLFDGGPRSKVEFSVGGHGPIAMERVARLDPAITELHLRHADVIKSWVQPQPSTHLWVSRLPELGAGTHTLTVRAVDEFGRAHHAHRIMEITPDAP